MTGKETAVIMEILRTAYPRFYAGISDEDAQQTLRLWAEMFADDDAALVAAAVKTLIASDEKGFPPHIGAIKNMMYSIISRNEPDAADAWNMVRKAISNSAYDSAEEFNKLPPHIRRVVGSPSQLRDWAMMDSEIVHSVVASNFQKSYRIKTEREKQLALMPDGIRETIAQIAGTMEMGAPKNTALPQYRESENGQTGRKYADIDRSSGL